MAFGAKPDPTTLPVDFRRRGLMLALSSPSGGGKTTISRRLIEQDKALSVSISATTRSKRSGEVEGQHYYFVAPDRFQNMIDNDELLEHARIYDHLYGTPKIPVEQALSNGRDVIFDIDWQGTRQLSRVAPDDIVSVFILPPSWAELERRLRGRGQDTEEQIIKRLAKAADEIAHFDEYHYALINNDLDDSIRKVQSILNAERLKRRRQAGLQAFVDRLTPGT